MKIRTKPYLLWLSSLEPKPPASKLNALTTWPHWHAVQEPKSIYLSLYLMQSIFSHFSHSLQLLSHFFPLILTHNNLNHYILHVPITLRSCLGVCDAYIKGNSPSCKNAKLKLLFLSQYSLIFSSQNSEVLDEGKNIQTEGKRSR